MDLSYQHPKLQQGLEQSWAATAESEKKLRKDSKLNSAIKVGDLSGPGPFSQDYKTSVLPSLVNRLSDDGLLEQMWEMWTCVGRIQSFVYQQPENRLYFSSIFSLIWKLLSLYIFQKFWKVFFIFHYKKLYL